VGVGATAPGDVAGMGAGVAETLGVAAVKNSVPASQNCETTTVAITAEALEISSVWRESPPSDAGLRSLTALPH